MMKDSECTYLYVLAMCDSGDTGFIKVGVSDNIKRRIRSLQCGSPFKFNVRKIFHVPNAYKIEKAIQKELNDFKVLGEWFLMNNESLKIIATLSHQLHKFNIPIDNIEDEFENKLLSLVKEDEK